MLTLSSSFSAIVRVFSSLSFDPRGMSQSTGPDHPSRKRKMSGAGTEDGGTSRGEAGNPSSKAKQRRGDLQVLEEEEEEEEEETGEADEEVAGPSHLDGENYLLPPSHKHRVRIRETELLPKHRQRPQASLSDANGLLEFPCDHYDYWVDISTSAGTFQRPKVTTGDYFLDSVLPRIEAEGYTVVQELEQGKFGSIFLAHSKSLGKYVALKFLVNNVKRKLRQPSGDNLTAQEKLECETNNEIAIHGGLKHSNVVMMLNSYCMGGRLCMVLGFCESGTLEQLLEATSSGLLTEAVSRRYLEHMLSAVEYIHSIDVVHRDIKCQNFLLDQFNIAKLCDFRTAKRHCVGAARLRDRCGSPGYQAPEILEEKPHDPRATDRWALGVILYRMTTSKLPFGTDPAEAVVGIRAGVDFQEARAVHLPADLRELLCGMLHYVVAERFTFNRVRQSAWFKQENRLSIGNHHMVRQPQRAWSEVYNLYNTPSTRKD